MRRGCVIDALRKFIISQGPSKNINNLEWASFWAENKKFIDPVAKRFTCITTENRYCFPLSSTVCILPVSVLVTLKAGGDDVPTEPEMKEVDCHKKNSALGKKQIYFSDKLLIEQEDAQTFKKGEEVSLPSLINTYPTFFTNFLLCLDHFDGLGKCNHSRHYTC